MRNEMGVYDRLRAAWSVLRATEDEVSALNAMGWGFSSPSATGIHVNQQTALQAVPVMACVNMISEDLAKCPINVYRTRPDGGRDEALDHELYDLLDIPNDWQTGMSFRTQMMIGLLLRGNGFAVKIRNGRGKVVMLVPINPDRVSLWEAPDGSMFWCVSRTGLHELALLRDLPLMIPYEDVFHLMGPSTNGLLGYSRITLAREAVALAIGQEQQAARWMGNGAKPQGILTTDNKLTSEAAERMKNEWQQMNAGILNTGKTAVFEQGLKWQALTLSSQDLEFIASRQFQRSEIGLMFRIPPHMMGDVARTGSTVIQLAAEYTNYTMSTYTETWKTALARSWGIRKRDKIEIDFDMSILSRGDILSRYNAYRMAIMGSFMTPDEARIDDGRQPKGGKADDLIFPANTTPFGSDHSGNAPDGAGSPSEGNPSADQPNAGKP